MTRDDDSKKTIPCPRNSGTRNSLSPSFFWSCRPTKISRVGCVARGSIPWPPALCRSQGKPRTTQSRVCRGTGVAADRKKCRKPVKRTQPKNRKAYRTAARKRYSGDVVASQNRVERNTRKCRDWNSPEQALAELPRLGFLQTAGRWEHYTTAVPTGNARSIPTLFFSRSSCRCHAMDL